MAKATRQQCREVLAHIIKLIENEDKLLPLTDIEIGKVVGLSPSMVKYYRNRHEIPNSVQRRVKEVAFSDNG